MKRHIIYITSIAVILLQSVLPSCREIYRHEPNIAEDVIVVDGLLSDRPGPHLIRLTGIQMIETSDPDNPHSPVNEGIPDYIRGASVIVADDAGNQFIFNEESPGHYYSDSTLRAVEGRSYSLHIITSNGHVYLSSPQQLPGPVTLDTLIAMNTYRERLMLSTQGTYFNERVHGLEIVANIRGSGKNRPLFRLVPQYLLLYTQTFANHQNFHWKKLYMPDNININMEAYEKVSATVRNHEVTFMSLREQDLYIDREDDFNPHRRILLLSLFSLNEESWNFYSSAHEQIHSEGRLFDPMAKQLPSNIYCDSDPGRLALGLFEVSRVTKRTFVVVETPWEDFYPLKETEDLHHIPDFGKTFIDPPGFWVDR